MNAKFLRTSGFAVVALSALAIAAQGITLRRTLTPETTEVYKSVSTLSQVMDLPGMGEQDMSVKADSTYTMKIGKVDAATGVADVDFITTVDKMEVGGSMASMMPADTTSKIDPVSVKASLDGRNRLVVKEKPKLDPSTAAIMSSMESTTSGMFLELPEKPIAVGDTWEVTIPKSPTFGNKEQKVTCKFVGEKEVEGKSYYHFTTSGTLNMDMEMTQDAGGMQMKMHITGPIKMTTEGLVEKDTGRTFRNTIKADFTNKVDMVDQGMSIPVTGKSTMTLSLVPAAK